MLLYACVCAQGHMCVYFLCVHGCLSPGNYRAVQTRSCLTALDNTYVNFENAGTAGGGEREKKEAEM